MNDIIPYKKESPIFGVAGLGGGITSYLTTSTATEAVYVDDVYNAFHIKGAGGVKRVYNNIDLETEGGVMIFRRNENNYNFRLTDTERNADADYFFVLNEDDDEGIYYSGWITDLHTDGYTMGSAEEHNSDGKYGCSWTFRQAPGFLDMVTYDGNATARDISHNLKSVPAWIWVKSRDSTDQDWIVYHKEHGNGKYSAINNDDQGTDSDIWDDTTPTSSVVRIGTSAKVNQSGGKYIMYIWGDDARFGENEDQQIAKAGTYTGDGSTTNDIELGWEPQHIFIRGTSYDDDTDWLMFDCQKTGITSVESGSHTGYWNLSSKDNLEENYGVKLNPNSTGFRLNYNLSKLNKSGETYVYYAIRRPDGLVGRPLEDGEHGRLLHIADYEGNNSADKHREASHTTLFNPDWIWAKRYDNVQSSSASDSWASMLRIHGKAWQEKFDASEEPTTTNQFVANWDQSQGIRIGNNARVNASSTNYRMFMWKRCPQVLDVVTWSGNSASNRAIPHKLGVTPDMIWVRGTGSNTPYYTVLSTLAGWTHSNASAESLVLYDSNAKAIKDLGESLSAPTATNIYMGGDGAKGNESGETYHAILWAKRDNILNMGSYVGDGYGGGNTPTAVTVTCGFQPRFIMIKNQNANTGWYVFDSVTGLTASNKKYLQLNSSHIHFESDNNWIYVTTDGFVVTNLASNDINEYSSSPVFNYFWMAIA